MVDIIKIIISILALVAGIAAYYLAGDLDLYLRILLVVAGVIVAGLIFVSSNQGREALAFAKGANIERQKVVWPDRREASMVTAYVIVMVFLIGIMLWVFDWLSFYLIYNSILGVR